MNSVIVSSKCMNWRTPDDLFQVLNNEFNFVLDSAADKYNHKCKNYYTVEDNSLTKSWNFGGSVFCNPPYGKYISKFVEKAFYESMEIPYPIVLLIPARTDTKWFKNYIFNKAEIRFISGRLKFISPDGKTSDCAPFPSMVVVYNPYGKVPKVIFMDYKKGDIK